MLLNEFLKEHRKVEEQGGTIAQQQKEIAVLAAQLKADKFAKLDTVARKALNLEESKPAVILNVGLLARPLPPRPAQQEAIPTPELPTHRDVPESQSQG